MTTEQDNLPALPAFKWRAWCTKCGTDNGVFDAKPECKVCDCGYECIVMQPNTYTPEETREYAALAVREALERSAPEIHADQLLGLSVSMDVSTGDDDATHRIFGTIIDTMPSEDGNIILAEEVSRNFGAAPAPSAQPGQEPEAGQPYMFKLPGDQDWHVAFAPLPFGAFKVKELEIAGQPTDSSSGAIAWTRLTHAGQVKPEDWVRFDLCGERKVHKVALILNAGTDKEEIIYHKRNNWYLITSMSIAGQGSQKNVEVLPVSAAILSEAGKSQGDNHREK